MIEKLVSIIVPSYNHEHFIVDCLESIKKQTYLNIELIIGDDCSFDSTPQIAKEWIEQNRGRFYDSKIVVNEENLGITKNCNNLLRKCKGDYIKLIASDDILVDDCIEKLVSFAEDNPKYDIVCSNVYIINEKASYPISEDFINGCVYDKPIDISRNFFDRLFLSNCIAAPSVLIRHKTIDKYGYFDESLSFEDWEYWLRVSRNGNIGYLDTNTVYYREQSVSASHFKGNDRNNTRFRKYVTDQEKILHKYARYTSCTLDYFYWHLIFRVLKNKDYTYLVSLLTKRKINILTPVRAWKLKKEYL